MVIMNVKTIGIDLATEVFQVYGIDEHGKRLFNRLQTESVNNSV
ncbi:hypothetical protein NT01EI_2391 [Edwardsiella ictaluri 93-146]|uniref:Transposase n=1 Tax=Edwardsiella ictaluri (strain 93-146) TaxID=634503 RepID=C5BA81_EDWI9|nr:hypothetical protein NT01EI_2391 [Edwardsiella ictaluri 93-146]